jgi:hypothetical protein
MILDERRKQKWQDYTATSLWMIGKALAADNWKLESYMEFAYPQMVDRRTPDQIKADIVRRLTS